MNFLRAARRASEIRRLRPGWPASPVIQSSSQQETPAIKGGSKRGPERLPSKGPGRASEQLFPSLPFGATKPRSFLRRRVKGVKGPECLWPVHSQCICLRAGWRWAGCCIIRSRGFACESWARPTRSRIHTCWLGIRSTHTLALAPAGSSRPPPLLIRPRRVGWQRQWQQKGHGIGSGNKQWRAAAFGRRK